MILSHEHRFICFFNGKTATASMETALNPYQEGQHLRKGLPGFKSGRHIPAFVVRGLVPKDVWDSYFKFAFVRNPWDWYVSQHFWNRRNMVTSRSRPFTNDQIMRTYHYLKSFRAHPDSPTLFQYDVLYDRGELLVDFVGRYERLKEDFAHVLAQIGISVELPWVNRTKHGAYRAYYTPETRELVGRLYAKDVETFGYEF